MRKGGPAASVIAALVIGAALRSGRAVADEGGVSFWLPGQYGSFAAIAPSPGWSIPLVFYNYGGSVGAGSLLPRGKLLSSGLNASFNGLFVVPTYTPATTVLGAQPNFSLAFAPAYTSTSARVGLNSLSASRSEFVVRRQRSLSDGAAVLEFWRSQRHGLPCGRYPGRQLRSQPVVKRRHRPWRDRRRRRLYLPEHEDRH